MSARVSVPADHSTASRKFGRVSQRAHPGKGLADNPDLPRRLIQEILIGLGVLNRGEKMEYQFE